MNYDRLAIAVVRTLYSLALAVWLLVMVYVLTELVVAWQAWLSR